MTKWSYVSAKIPLGELDEHLNTYGARGWEVVAIDWDYAPANVCVIFKRPVSE